MGKLERKIAEAALSSAEPGRNLDVRRSGLAEFRSRNLFEDGAKLDRRVLTECAFEAAPRCSPARTGFGDSSLSCRCQRDDTAAPILLGHVELDEAALLEWAQKMPQRRAIHDQKPCEILDRTRTDATQPRQDRKLVHAQPGGREGFVIKSCHAPRRLAKRGAIADFGLDIRHWCASSPCKDYR